MCAINGCNFVDGDLIDRMNTATIHRGPDNTGVFCGNGVSLGHNRLSIIDTSPRSNQPMQSNSGRYTVTFNGEIYNYRELRKELQPKYDFKTDGDAEVILAAYERWGSESFTKLSGIFALCIFDREKEALIVARDQLGVKPLYYHWKNGAFVFSSELRGVLEAEHIDRKVSVVALNHFIRLNYVPAPLTMVEGVYKFPAASFGIITKDNLSIQSFWPQQPLSEKSQCKSSKSEIAVNVKKIVTRVVKRQLISDRPVGVYLSGGIDSSVILDRVASVRGNIETFSVGFELDENEGRDRFNVDYDLARQTAQHYGTNHNEVKVSSDDIVKRFEQDLSSIDEPIFSPTMLPRIMLAQMAKKKVDVTLVGDGADELFGGYKRYMITQQMALYQVLAPSIVRKHFERLHPNLAKLNTKAGLDLYKQFMFRKDQDTKNILNATYQDLAATDELFRDQFFNTASSQTMLGEFMSVCRKSWVTDFALMLGDKTTMSTALEARVPFLDTELVEFATSIPTKYKADLFNTKIILKEAFKNDIPEFLLDKPKHGWISPGAKWLRHERFFNLVKEILHPDYYVPTNDLFNWSIIQNKLELHRKGEEYNLDTIWLMLTFQVWAKTMKVTV